MKQAGVDRENGHVSQERSLPRENWGIKTNHTQKSPVCFENDLRCPQNPGWPRGEGSWDRQGPKRRRTWGWEKGGT